MLASLLGLAACSDDGGAAQTGASEDAGTSDVGTTTTTSPTTGATDQPSETGSGPGTDGETGTSDTDAPDVVGPNFGLLTFTLYEADAAGSPEQLGMAGAWRTEAFTTDDFFAVHALGLYLPLAPAAVDTLEPHEPGVYEWGKGSTWVTLGEGMRLTHEDGGALACLEVVGDLYPVYFSDDAPFFDPACAPDPAYWLPGTTYDLVSYGGETYDDQLRPASVVTPTPLTVTAPALDVFDFPLSRADDLAFTWQADGADGDRVVIRIWDQFGRQLVVHAADDGSYTIPAAELNRLAVGPVTLTLAREHLSELGLAAGTLRVVARHEVSAYPDLF